MRVERIFKEASMGRRLAGSAAGPKMRNKWQATAAQEIGWFAEPLVPQQPRKGIKQTPIT